MALTPCRACGKDVNGNVVRCPHCGARTAYGDTNLRGCAALALLGGVLFLVVWFKVVGAAFPVADVDVATPSTHEVTSCQPASGRIEIGSRLYYDVGGGERTFAGTVVEIGSHDFGDGRERAVRVQLSDGSSMWRKRNAIATDPSWLTGPGC